MQSSALSNLDYFSGMELTRTWIANQELDGEVTLKIYRMSNGLYQLEVYHERMFHHACKPCDAKTFGDWYGDDIDKYHTLGIE